MGRNFFEEKQSFKQARWMMYWVILVSLVLVLSLGYGMYWQLVMGEFWGDRPMTNEGLLLLGLVMLVIVGLVLWLVFSITLETRIDDAGVHYRFFPNQFKWKVIHRDEIERYELRKVNLLLQAGGWGYYRNYFKKLKAMTISGNKILELKLKNGQLLRIGTQDIQSMEWAMKKLMSPAETR